MYIYAAALLDRNCDYDKVKEDYFSHIYGEAAKEAQAYLTRISELFDFAFMEGERSVDPAKGPHYNPEHAKQLEQVKEAAAEGRALAKAHLAMPTRPQTVSMRLLLRHTEYCEKLAEIYIQKALGNNEEAAKLWEDFCDSFGTYEFELERYFDHCLAMTSLRG